MMKGNSHKARKSHNTTKVNDHANEEEEAMNIDRWMKNNDY